MSSFWYYVTDEQQKLDRPINQKHQAQKFIPLHGCLFYRINIRKRKQSKRQTKRKKDNTKNPSKGSPLSLKH